MKRNREFIHAGYLSLIICVILLFALNVHYMNKRANILNNTQECLGLIEEYKKFNNRLQNDVNYMNNCIKNMQNFESRAYCLTPTINNPAELKKQRIITTVITPSIYLVTIVEISLIILTAIILLLCLTNFKIKYANFVR